VNFITQTYEERTKPVTVQAKMIETYYPESKFYIYDGGLSKRSKTRLDSFDVVEVVDWQENSNFSLNNGCIKDKISKIEVLAKNNTYTNHIINNLIGYEYYFLDYVKWNFFMKQKPLSILDLCRKGKKNIVWMDDDVILINKFDEIYDHSFDIGVTLRSKYDEKRASGIGSVNAGVLFFNTSSKNIQNFVGKWLNLIEQSTLTKNLEQEMLEKLISHSSPEFTCECYNKNCIKLSEEKLSIQTFPCKKYNHMYLKYGINPEINKILHFKGGRLDYDVNKEMINDIYNGDLDDWYRGCN
jgi:hypothetical protein